MFFSLNMKIHRIVLSSVFINRLTFEFAYKNLG